MVSPETEVMRATEPWDLRSMCPRGLYVRVERSSDPRVVYILHIDEPRAVVGQRQLQRAVNHSGSRLRASGSGRESGPKDSDVNYLAIGAKGAGGAETISRREMQRSRDNRGIGARQKAVRLAAVAARVG